MIKVLNKILAVLEAVSEATPAPVGLADIAEQAGINKTTCSRIIRDLVDNGYLEQVSRHAGYRTGARFLAFGNRAAEGTALVRSGNPIVHALGKATGQMAMLAVLQHGYRYILACRSVTAGGFAHAHPLVCDDTCNTVTGLVLLAYADQEKELQAAMALRAPAACPLLQDAKGKMSLVQFLAKIRDERGLVYQGGVHPDKLIIGYPVFCDSDVIAAVGLAGVSGSETANHETIELVKQAAAEISAALSKPEFVG